MLFIHPCLFHFWPCPFWTYFVISSGISSISFILNLFLFVSVYNWHVYNTDRLTVLVTTSVLKYFVVYFVFAYFVVPIFCFNSFSYQTDSGRMGHYGLKWCAWLKMQYCHLWGVFCMTHSVLIGYNFILPRWYFFLLLVICSQFFFKLIQKHDDKCFI